MIRERIPDPVGLVFISPAVHSRKHVLFEGALLCNRNRSVRDVDEWTTLVEIVNRKVWPLCARCLRQLHGTFLRGPAEHTVVACACGWGSSEGQTRTQAQALAAQHMRQVAAGTFSVPKPEPVPWTDEQKQFLRRYLEPMVVPRRATFSDLEAWREFVCEWAAGLCGERTVSAPVRAAATAIADELWAAKGVAT